jgi:hypothetical protein
MARRGLKYLDKLIIVKKKKKKSIKKKRGGEPNYLFLLVGYRSLLTPLRSTL